MRTVHRVGAWLTLVWALAGCGAEERRHPRTPLEADGRSIGDARPEERVVPSPGDGDGAAWAPTTIVRGGSRSAFPAIRIGSSEPRLLRPPRRKHIDLDLKNAAVGNVLQFIADAGGFNLVVEGELSAEVTLRLRDVDPFDALTTVAEAEGLDVEMERGIVIVTARGSARLAGAAP